VDVQLRIGEITFQVFNNVSAFIKGFFCNVGIHTGSCMGSVVSLNKPRYLGMLSEYLDELRLFSLSVQSS